MLYLGDGTLPFVLNEIAIGSAAQLLIRTECGTWVHWIITCSLLLAKVVENDMVIDENVEGDWR